MKQLYILLLLVCANILSLSGQIRNATRSVMNEVEILQDEGYSHIRMENALSMDEIGKPELPYFVKTFVLPEGAKVDSISILSLSKQALFGQYLIYPAQPPFAISEPKPDFVEPDVSVYASSESFPGKQAEIASEGIEHGYNIVRVKVQVIRKPVKLLRKVLTETLLTMCAVAF